jgi:hypothetical protein
MFGKIFTILGLVTVSVMASEFDLSDEIAQLEQFAGDVYQIGAKTHYQVENNKRAYKQELAGIIQRAEAEVQLNYAKIIQPVAQDYADFLKTLDINKACNETCVKEDCFTPHNWAMNWTCVTTSCKCHLKDPQATQQAANDLMNSVDNVVNNVVPSFVYKKHSEVAEAYRNYRLKQTSVVMQAGKEVQSKVTVLIPEAQKCFNYCDNYYSTDFTKYLRCLDRCGSSYDYLERTGAFN